MREQRELAGIPYSFPHRNILPAWVLRGVSEPQIICRTRRRLSCGFFFKCLKGAFPHRSPRPRGWTPWCPVWPKFYTWKTRPASRWRWGCWCGITQTSGGSTWQPSWTCGASAAPPPAMRSWRWPGTWNCRRGAACHALGTVPSSQTSLCPGRPSASASLSSWAASPCPGWPACPGLGPRLHPGPGPNAETLQPRLGVPHSLLPGQGPTLGQGSGRCGPPRSHHVPKAA
uniref:Uncharacterized protein n=1 Tax=Sus scrofa TaxID=9823 RepID=A0A8D0MFL6_PIG